MKEKNQKIIPIIFSLMTGVLVVLSFTMSYFSSIITGTSTTANIATTNVGIVTFSGGANFTDNEAILPGWEKYTDATISVAPSNHQQKLDLNIDYTNTFTDIEYKVELISVAVGENTPTATNSLVTNTLTGTYTLLPTATTSSIVTLGTATFSPSNSTITAVYRIYMRLPQSAGNSNMGKEFNGVLYTGINQDNSYYYNSFTSGTNIDPNL